MRLIKRISILSLASLLSLAACGGEEEPGGEACTSPTGDDHTYVVDSLATPGTVPQATEDGYALDIDGIEETQKLDNQLGTVLASLSGLLETDIGGTLNEELQTGNVIILANLKAGDLAASSCAGLSVLLGASPDPAACTDPADLATCGKHLEGGAGFQIDASSPDNASLNGRIVGNKFSVDVAVDDPRQVSLELALIDGQPPVALSLFATRASARVSSTGLEGVLGGAIKETDLLAQLLPVITSFIDGIVAADCPDAVPPDACCMPDTTGALVVDTFDADKDCLVSLSEIQNNSLVQSTLRADLDLFDASGAFVPDGEMDSLSLGIGFTATTATFVP